MLILVSLKSDCKSHINVQNYFTFFAKPKTNVSYTIHGLKTTYFLFILLKRIHVLITNRATSNLH